MTYAVGSTLLALGFIAGLVGLGLMYFSAEDEQSNREGWFFSDAERSEDNQQRYEAGRLLMWGGLVVLVVGAVLMITGGSRRAHH